MHDACQKFDYDLILLAYDQLDAAEKRNLLNHVGTCPACRREIEDLEVLRRQIQEGFEGFPAPEIDEGTFLDRVLTKVGSEPATVLRGRTSTRKHRRVTSSRRRRAMARRRITTGAALSAAAGVLLAAGLAWWAFGGAAGTKPAPTKSGPGDTPKGPGQVAKLPTLPELVGRAKQAKSPEDLRALAAPMARLLDREMAGSKPDLVRWTHLTTAEELARSADRMEYREAICATLELASAIPQPPKHTGGESGPPAFLRKAVRSEEGTGGQFVSLPRPGSAEEVMLTGRLLARQARRALSSKDVSTSGWKKARGVALPDPAPEAKGLSPLATVARGDLAAAALDFDRAIGEWIKAERALSARQPELAAALRLRTGCVLHLARNRHRDAWDAFKTLTSDYPRTAATRKYKAVLAVAFAPAVKSEKKAAGTFLAAMGIPFDVRQSAVPFDALPTYSTQVSADAEPQERLVLRKFMMPFQVHGVGRGTVISGQIRFWAKLTDKPLEVSLWSLTSGDKTPLPQESLRLVHGMTYRFRLVLWRPSGQGSHVKLHVAYAPEGRALKPSVLSSDVGKAGKAGSKEKTTCDVLCSGTNVVRMDLFNPQLRTDVDLSRPVK